jgi:mono/diheme cytochrome c family protein
MMDYGRECKLRPIPALAYGLVGASATAFIVGLAAFAAPQPAGALPAYAQQTKLACGRCHVNAAGGGALTGFGKAFAANGHKVPSKGAKPAKGVSEGPSAPAEAAPAAESIQVLRGTASVFFTTAPGVSNQSATPECFNCGVFLKKP